MFEIVLHDKTLFFKFFLSLFLFAFVFIMLIFYYRNRYLTPLNEISVLFLLFTASLVYFSRNSIESYVLTKFLNTEEKKGVITLKCSPPYEGNVYFIRNPNFAMFFFVRDLKDLKTGIGICSVTFKEKEWMEK